MGEMFIAISYRQRQMVTEIAILAVEMCLNVLLSGLTSRRFNQSFEDLIKFDFTIISNIKLSIHVCQHSYLRCANQLNNLAR